MSRAERLYGPVADPAPTPVEDRRKIARIPLDVDCLVELGGRTFPMRIENASATGLLLSWDFNAYLLLRTGWTVVARWRMGGDEVRAEGRIARVEYRSETVQIAVSDVVWFR